MVSDKHFTTHHLLLDVVGFVLVELGVLRLVVAL